MQPTKTETLQLVAELTGQVVATSSLAADLWQRLAADDAESPSPQAIDELAAKLRQLDDGLRGLRRQLGIDTGEIAKPSAAFRPDDLWGSSRAIPTADLLATLSAQQKTGTLWVQTKAERFTLELVNGAIVHLMTDRRQPGQDLGAILVARDAISQDKLDGFLSGIESGAKIGAALAQADLVSSGDVRDALEEQVRALVDRVIEASPARYCFRPGRVSELEVRVCLNVTQLLLDSARRADERSFLFDEV